MNPDGNPTILEVGWEWSVTSGAAVLSVLGLAVHSMPAGLGGPGTRWPSLAFATVAAVLPIGWAAMVIMSAATPDCADEVLLHDRFTSHQTMPNGDRALTTSDSIIDEATRAMAFGVMLLGMGSAALALLVVAEHAGLGDGGDGGISLSLMHAVAAVGALVLYTAGGAEIHRKATGSVPWRWSKEQQNEARVQHECTTGSGAVFGQPLAPESRDEFFNLITASFYTSAGVLALCVVAASAAAIFRLSPTTSGNVGAGCGLCFVAVHALMTMVLTQAVYTGSNPQCTEYLLATNRRAGDGLLAASVGMTAFGIYTLLTTRQHGDPPGSTGLSSVLRVTKSHLHQSDAQSQPGGVVVSSVHPDTADNDMHEKLGPTKNPRFSSPSELPPPSPSSFPELPEPSHAPTTFQGQRHSAVEWGQPAKPSMTPAEEIAAAVAARASRMSQRSRSGGSGEATVEVGVAGESGRTTAPVDLEYVQILGDGEHPAVEESCDYA